MNKNAKLDYNLAIPKYQMRLFQHIRQIIN